jgi:hypothetical protein
MADESALKVKAGDTVRVHYCPPGQVMSFAEGVVSRVNMTSTRGPGFLIDITRDVFLGREQPVKPGYQHYVLYERPEGFPGQVEVLPQVQREPASHLEHGSEAEVAQKIEQEPEAAAVPESEQMPVVEAEQEPEEIVPNTDAEADRSQAQVERQEDRARSSRIISLFGWRK